MLATLRSLCDCLMRHPKKRLSKTYLESLKDIQERKFSSSKKASACLDLELHEISHSPHHQQKNINEPLIELNEDLDANSEPKTQRESVRKLEKFHEDNIKTLFSTIIDKVNSPYDGFDKIHEDLKSAHGLVMYMASELDADKNRIFTLRTEWIAPCDPPFFMKMLEDYEEQIKLSDNKMEEYYPIKSFGANENFHIVYLKYKKVLTYSPRDFCYLKCSQCLDSERNIWIESSQSISNELLPEYDDIVRGNILLHGYYVEPYQGGYTKVRFYSRVNFKVSLPAFVSRTFSVVEMKKYVQRCFERILALKNKQG